MSIRLGSKSMPALDNAAFASDKDDGSSQTARLRNSGGTRSLEVSDDKRTGDVGFAKTGASVSLRMTFASTMLPWNRPHRCNSAIATTIAWIQGAACSAGHGLGAASTSVCEFDRCTTTVNLRPKSYSNAVADTAKRKASLASKTDVASARKSHQEA